MRAYSDEMYKLYITFRTSKSNIGSRESGPMALLFVLCGPPIIEAGEDKEKRPGDCMAWRIRVLCMHLGQNHFIYDIHYLWSPGQRAGFPAVMH